MFLSDIPRALIRRWYVVLLGLLITAGLGSLALEHTSPDYTVVAETLLLPPSTSVPQGGNPYLSLGGLNAVGDILSRAMSDTTATGAMQAAGLKGDFSLVRDTNSAAPMMLLTVTSGSDREAVYATKIVLDQIPTTLKNIQAATKVPTDSLITSAVVVHPDHATSSNKGQLRALLVAVSAGLALSILMTAVVDALLTRRSARRSARRSGQPVRPGRPRTRGADPSALEPSSNRRPTGVELSAHPSEDAAPDRSDQLGVTSGDPASEAVPMPDDSYPRRPRKVAEVAPMTSAEGGPLTGRHHEPQLVSPGDRS